MVPVIFFFGVRNLVKKIKNQKDKKYTKRRDGTCGGRSTVLTMLADGRVFRRGSVALLLCLLVGAGRASGVSVGGSAGDQELDGAHKIHRFCAAAAPRCASAALSAAKAKTVSAAVMARKAKPATGSAQARGRAPAATKGEARQRADAPETAAAANTPDAVDTARASED